MANLNATSRAPTEVFAPWVDWQQETCRGGRQLITAVNHRAGHAMYLDPADLAHVAATGAARDI